MANVIRPIGSPIKRLRPGMQLFFFFVGIAILGVGSLAVMMMRRDLPLVDTLAQSDITGVLLLHRIVVGLMVTFAIALVFNWTAFWNEVKLRMIPEDRDNIRGALWGLGILILFFWVFYVGSRLVAFHYGF